MNYLHTIREKYAGRPLLPNCPGHSDLGNGTNTLVLYHGTSVMCDIGRDKHSTKACQRKDCKLCNII
jgi:hypothetical protein